MNQVASEQIRRDNIRAVRRRNEWRERYQLVAEGIRENRKRIRESHRTNNKDSVAEIQLRSLRLTARLMMLSRKDISADLRDTAYRWVDLAEDAR